MFNDKYGLTQAVLSGRKTMPRRIIPPIEIEWARRGKVTLPVSAYRHGTLWMDCRQFLPDSGLFDYAAPQKYQPLYDIGEEVAIAQTYKDAQWKPDTLQQVWVKEPTIFPALDPITSYCGWVDLPLKCHEGWNNKMFVMAGLMPHAIRITRIEATRLQYISDKDCLREGVEKWMNCYIVAGIMEHGGKNNATFNTPQQAFAALINRISGKGTWESNPWTYIYEFELVR